MEGKNIAKLKTGIKNHKCYVCNCTKCGYLHFWNKKSVEAHGSYKYRCRGCGKINDIKKEDLM